MKPMTIAEVIQALEKGEKVRRQDWLPVEYLVNNPVRGVVTQDGVFVNVDIFFNNDDLAGWEIAK